MKIDFLPKLPAILVLLAFLTGCTSKPRELKSPCVGIDGAPCARRSPANQFTADSYQLTETEKLLSSVN